MGTEYIYEGSEYIYIIRTNCVLNEKKYSKGGDGWDYYYYFFTFPLHQHLHINFFVDLIRTDQIFKSGFFLIYIEGDVVDG